MFNEKIIDEMSTLAANTFDSIMKIADKYGEDRKKVYNNWISTFRLTVTFGVGDNFDGYTY